MPEQHAAGGFTATLAGAIELVSLAIELLAVAIIVVVILFASVSYVARALNRQAADAAYQQYKIRLGKGLLLGLEILVAADVIRTVALEPTLTNVATLGVLVLIRTFLSWSLVVEIEGRWPWQRRREANARPGGEGAEAVE
jgi:uncharacterized membrane protein